MKRSLPIFSIALVAFSFLSVSCDKRPLEQKGLDDKSLTSPDPTKKLLNEGMDPNKAPLLFGAVERRQKETVKALLEGGAAPDAFRSENLNKTALFIAAYNGDKEICEMLLAHGADPNAVDMHGNTALREAIGNRKEKIVQLLLSKGANPDHKNQDGTSVRNLAEKHGTPAIKAHFAASPSP